MLLTKRATQTKEALQTHFLTIGPYFGFSDANSLGSLYLYNGCQGLCDVTFWFANPFDNVEIDFNDLFSQARNLCQLYHFVN